MRAIKIDPNTRTVTEINLPDQRSAVWPEIRKIIGCELLQPMQGLNSTLYLDEEGRLRTPMPPAFHFFRREYVGIACVVGVRKTRSGVLRDAALTIPLDAIVNKVDFDVPPADPAASMIKIMTWRMG